MTIGQINDVLLQIAKLDGQINVHEENIEQIKADLEYITLQDFEKNSLDESDLKEINKMRTDYMIITYRLRSCRNKIVELKKEIGIDVKDDYIV